jgi:molecular chaperone GrpE
VDRALTTWSTPRSSTTTRSELLGVTDSDSNAGSADDAGPARERLVVRDKRRINPFGQPKAGDAVTAPAERDEREGGAESATGGDAERAIGVASVDGAVPGEDGSAVEGVVVEASDVDTPGPTDAADDPTIEVESDATSAGHGPTDVAPPFIAAELEALRAELEETIKDLQRVSAEYANYRKRVERDRSLVGEQATGAVLAALLPVLDDLDRARDHGDLVGPFGSVADQLNATVAKFGLAGFGDKGDPFDPTVHEAVAHRTSADVTEPTCVEVMRRGYMLGDRLLRPALVAVADPE